jgi:hypothetical protein
MIHATPPLPPRSLHAASLRAWATILLAVALAACGTATGAAQPTSTSSPTGMPAARTVGPTGPPEPPAPVATLPPSAALPDDPTPAAAGEPAPTAPPLDPPTAEAPAEARPFAMNLYHRGDFATQVTKTYCVPGAMQTMMNVIDKGATRASRARQDRLYRLARRLSTDRLRGAGAEPEGWARGLERLGYGGYEVVETKTRAGAIRVAARAIRETGRPAGLLVWRGAHAWVMTGFRATADPADHRDFRVTHVRIVDVWYPRVSSIWGASVRPNTLVRVGKLREDYLRWRRPLMKYAEKDGKYVLVVPVDRPA